MAFGSFLSMAGMGLGAMIGGPAGAMIGGMAGQALGGMLFKPKRPGLPDLQPFAPRPVQDQWWMSGAGMSEALAGRDEDRRQQGYLGRRHATAQTALGSVR